MRIEFYKEFGEYGYMANYSNHGFYINDIFYKTVEHYYQSEKYSDNKIKQKILKYYNEEIENYIPIDAIEKTHGKKIKNALGQYELFPDYIHSLEPTFTNNKVAYANKVCKNITVENSELIYDLKDKITTIYNTIKLWNRI